MLKPTLAPWFRPIPATGAQATLDIDAAASPLYSPESQTSLWLEMPVLEGLHTRLSASAVDTYERCGLRFKLDRDWRLAARPAPAMQYGAAIHRVLKTYFDSVRAGRPKPDEELIALFQQDLADAEIEEAYQQELYEKQGIVQLLEFLASARAIPASQVLHTEESFEIRFGETVVVGRIDRIDRSPDGTCRNHRLQDRKGPRSGRCRSEPATLFVRHRRAREVGIQSRSVSLSQPGRERPVTTMRSESELIAARERVQAAAQGIAAGIFDPKPGIHCNFCAYRSLCPEKEKRIPHRAEIPAAHSN